MLQNCLEHNTPTVIVLGHLGFQLSPFIGRLQCAKCWTVDPKVNERWP